MGKLKRIILKGLPGDEKLDLVSKYARLMVELGKRSIKIRDLAVKLTGKSCKGRDYLCEAKTLHTYVQKNVRYVKDTANVERFAIPQRTIFMEKAGDCDDSSIALSALLESIGHETRLILIDPDLSGKFTHVISQVRIGDKWYWMETTKKVPFNWAPNFTVSHIIDKESVCDEDMEELKDLFGTDIGDLGARRSKARKPGRKARGRISAAVSRIKARAKAKAGIRAKARKAAVQKARRKILATAGKTRAKMQKVAGRAARLRRKKAQLVQMLRKKAADRAKTRIHKIQKSRLEKPKKAALIAAAAAKAKAEQERIARAEEKAEQKISRQEEAAEQAIIDTAPPEEVRQEYCRQSGALRICGPPPASLTEPVLPGQKQITRFEPEPGIEEEAEAEEWEFEPEPGIEEEAEAEEWEFEPGPGVEEEAEDEEWEFEPGPGVEEEAEGEEWELLGDLGVRTESEKERKRRLRKRAILAAARRKPKGTTWDRIIGTVTQLSMLGMGTWAGVSLIGKLIERRK